VPDFGLDKALAKALKAGSKDVKVVRPAEADVLAREKAKLAPAQAVQEASAVPEPQLGSEAHPQVDQPTVAIDEPQPIAQAAEPTVDPTPELPLLPDQTRLDATRLTNAKLGDYNLDAPHQTNFDTITTTDELKSVLADTAEKNKGKIDEARRGVITNEQLSGLATDLDLNEGVVKKIMERETGGTFNAETILAARQVLNASADRIHTLAKKITTGQATDIERLQFRRQLQFHGDYQTQFMGARAEAGRALNAFSIPTGLDPARLAQVKDMVEGSLGHDTDKLAKVLAETDNIAAVSKLARKYNQSKMMGVANELFVNSILSGPKTNLVNTMGNALFQGMNVVENAVAARLGKFLPGEDHVKVGEASAMLHGTLSGVKDGWRLASKAFKSGRTMDDILKFETGTPRAISAQNLLPAQYQNTWLGKFTDVLGSAIRVPTERVLAPTDEFFKALAYRAELERQALLHAHEQVSSGAKQVSEAADTVRDFLENSPLKAKEAADEYARYATFQNSLGETGNKIQAAIRSAPGLSLIAPFIRTPVNLFKAGLAQRSPLALASRKFWEDVAAGGRRRDLAVARATMGSLTSAMVAYHVMNGNLTGGGPQDDNARQALEATGWRPYSIRWRDPTTNEDKYTSYARMEPLAFVLGATADATEILSYVNSDVEPMGDEADQTKNAIAAIIAGIANNTMSKTFMKGFADFTEVMNDPKRYADQWAGNFATSFIPYSSLRKQIGQIEDPYMREAWTTLDKVKTQSGIPGYSQDAPPRRDLFGEPRKYAAGDIIGPMSPIPSSPEQYDPVTSEIVNVMEQTRTVPVTMPDKRIEGLRLTAPEYDELTRYSRQEPLPNGRTFKEELDRVMSSAVYLKSTPYMQAELLKDVQHRADAYAKARLEKENPEFHDRITLYRDKQARLRFDK
jgi:hypothetical protein